MNQWRTQLGRAAIAVWVGGLVLWPIPTDLRMEHEADHVIRSAGEGLYKSNLTEANFGLLGARLFESSMGQKHWNMLSEFAELHRRDRDYAFMKAVTADFHARETGNVVHTKSDYGRSYFGRRLVELEGNVEVQSRQGYHFTMNRLDYNSAARRFASNDLVHMKGPDPENPEMFLTGTGLDADLESEDFRIRKNTRARRRIGEQEWIRVQSNQGEFHPQVRKAIFTERVKIWLPNLSVESDRLEMNMAGTDDLLRASGRVTLRHKDRRGHSRVADIEMGSDKVILEGDARFESNDNEIRGRRITFYANDFDGRVEVEQAVGSMNK